MKITINKKDYELGHVTRAKYAKFNEAYKKIEAKANVYDDEDFDIMVDCIVECYDNQFTADDVNQLDVSDIIIGFMSIMIHIQEKLNNKVTKIKKSLPKL